MLDINYVKEHINEFEEDICFDRRFAKRFIGFVPISEWDKFGFKYVGEGEYGPIEWTEENVLAQLKVDVAFGYEMAVDEKGVSSKLMALVVNSWCKILQNGLDLNGNDGYYHIKQFTTVAQHYGWELKKKYTERTMIDYNFTDDKVIKALECCDKGSACISCPLEDDDSHCVSSLTHLALSLINKQKTDLDLLKSTITRKEKDAYNKGYEDGKADMRSKISILTVQNMALENTKSELQHELNKYKGAENILKDNMGELITAAIVQAKQELARGILMDIKALMQIIILDYKEIGSFDNAEIVGYVQDHLLSELEKRYVEGEPIPASEEKHFSPEDVSKMTPQEVREKYTAICKSMEMW